MLEVRRHLRWDLVVLCFFASILSGDAVPCIDEARHVNITAGQTSFATEVDFPPPTTHCQPSLITWTAAATEDGTVSAGWIIVDILNFSLPRNASLSFAPSAGAEFAALEPGLQRRLFAGAGEAPRLQLAYWASAQELANGTYRFHAELSLANETDCGEHFFCEYLMTCLDSSVVCDGTLQCPGIEEETNCEECGETTHNLALGQPVSLVGLAYPANHLCVWQFRAPPGSRFLLRFVKYATPPNAFFSVSTVDISIDSFIADPPPPEIIFYRYFNAFSAAPRLLVFRLDILWVGFAYAHTGASAQLLPTDQVVRFEVTAVNDTVTCDEAEFLCDSGIQCISNGSRCDGVSDCEDYSDELGCSDNCGPREMTCSPTADCLKAKSICDSKRDCQDFRDEIDCTSACGERFISLQPAVPRTLTSPNAPAGHPSRLICVWLVTAPPGARILVRAARLHLGAETTLTVGEGAAVVNASSSRLLWQRRGGTAPLLALSEGHGIWVSLEDADTSPWFGMSTASPVSEVHFILELYALEDTVNCRADVEFACKNGNQCVNSSDACDGVLHCHDYSDEMGCDGRCPDMAIHCANSEGDGICVDRAGICNGTADCVDFIDETGCSNFCGRRYIDLEEYGDIPYNITSPENGYPPFVDCLWVVTTTLGQTIHIHIRNQSLAEGDTTVFGEGADPSNRSTIVETVRGRGPPRGFTSSADFVWVRFSAATDLSGGSFWYQFSSFNKSGPCGESSYKCPSSGLCVAAESICDGRITCNDASDEAGCDHCGGISTINVTSGQPFTLQMVHELDAVNFPYGRSCLWHVAASTGHRIRVTVIDLATAPLNWLYFGDGEVSDENTRAAIWLGNFALLFTASETDTMWIVFNTETSYDDRFTLEIQQYEPVECDEEEFACPSGLACIPQDQVCDGTPQCPLKRDEIGCDSCGANFYTCSDGTCVDAIYDMCNSKADCSNLWDETNCYPCGESFLHLSNATEPAFTLTSLGFPSSYPNDALCVWFVTAEPGAVVALRFSHLDLEQYYDYLTLGNGLLVASDQDSTIIRLTGSLNTAQVFAKGHEMWIQFTTDRSITASGFSVTVTQEMGNGSCELGFACADQSSGLTCLEDRVVCDGFAVCPDASDEQNCGECGANVFYVYEEPVTLTSPLYPNSYPNSLTCTWQIIGALEADVYLRIHEFSLESGFDFLIFSLEILTPQSLKELFRLTGSDISQRVISWVSLDVMWLKLKTDQTTTSSGFSITIAHVQNDTNSTDLGALCLNNEFHCGDGMCIVEKATCNGYLDCVNYEDEADCNDVFCPGSYKCDNINIGRSADTNSQDGSPSGGSSSAGTPSAGSPSAGFPSAGSPSASSPSAGSPSASSSSASSDSFSSSTDGDEGLYLPQAQCIPRTQVCNGEPNCPGGDDETECDAKRCPAGCQCSYKGLDLEVSCANGWGFETLLDVAPTTHTLHLAGVNITRLEAGTFKALTNLKVLSLRNSDISEIEKHTFDGLYNLLWLDLSNTPLMELRESRLMELTNLSGITIFDVPLAKIKQDAFEGLSKLKTLIIVRNIKGLLPLQLDENAFRGLDGVTELYVDDHRLCCYFPSATDCKTLEPEPPLFQCSELMPKMVLKIFMWILGISALVGNVFVMVWRCREKTAGRPSRVVHSFLVFNLAVSDAFMGLYMLIIAGADVHFGRRYFEVSDEWRTSAPCQVASFLSILASEASVFFLTLISVDRFLSIVYPFSRYHLRPQSARVVALCIWIGTVVVALVPTILATDTTSDVYGLSDVCIGLPLQTKVTEYMTVEQAIKTEGGVNITVEIPVPVDTRPSWFFSIALFLGVNLLCFAVILACYIAIFIRVRASVSKVRRHKKRDDEVRMAVKMAAIITTDFVCWVPVIIMGILSQARLVEIPGEMYAWIVVFILPINSSLNPYLYTLSDICSHRRRSASTRSADMAMKNSDNRISTITNLSSETESKHNQ